MGLKGLEGGEEWLGPVGLLALGRVDEVDLVLVVLRRGLGGHVADVVDLRGGGVVVGLLDGVGSLGRWLGWLGAVGLVDLLLLESPLDWRLGLMMALETLSALMRLPIKLSWEGGRFLVGLMQELGGGVVGLSLVYLMGLVEQFC